MGPGRRMSHLPCAKQLVSGRRSERRTNAESWGSAIQATNLALTSAAARTGADLVENGANCACERGRGGYPVAVGALEQVAALRRGTMHGRVAVAPSR